MLYTQQECCARTRIIFSKTKRKKTKKIVGGLLVKEEQQQGGEEGCKNTARKPVVVWEHMYKHMCSAKKNKLHKRSIIFFCVW